MHDLIVDVPFHLFMELVLVVEESSGPLPINEELRGGVLFVNNALGSIPMVIPRSGSY